MLPTLKKCCLAAACLAMTQYAGAATTAYSYSPPALYFYQDKKINGAVSGADGEKLPGVSVRVKGTSRGTLTAVDGSFSLQLPDGPVTLVFSFTGYQPHEVNVAGSAPLNIILQPAAGELNEVVVVGYGQQKKTSLTGSVASLDQKALANRPITNSSQALQGLPGVYVNQVQGRPGADG
ncbi:carboxypeptidase-like regulatory domain-containing protein [Chitinophaga sp. 22620]|uniref:carboxypeptidase-like regulatory domain-containing protein n=1 Tax=Chitinophaga sp. 22620 TaxID=3453952 RepID=UPI003F87C4F4